MVKMVRFVFNRKAFQDQVLYSDVLGKACAAVLGDDAVVERSSNEFLGGRARARLYGKMADEVSSGALSRRLGGRQ